MIPFRAQISLRRRPFLLAVLTTVVLGCSGAPAPRSATSAAAGLAGVWPYRDGLADDTVRVGLVVDAASVALEALDGLKISDGTGKVHFDRRGQHRLTATPWRGGFALRAGAGDPLLVDRAWLRLRGRGAEAVWTHDGNQYAGEIYLRRRGRGVTLVNVLPMETYLRGVVPWEIGRPGLDALEAVKAQAIAARTYTYAHLARREGLGFDVYDTVDDQVYRGLTGVHAVSDRAVRETRDLVAAHRGQLLRAYYSSTCGGHTSTLLDVWTREPAEYLVGRRDAPGTGPSWCRDSPHFRWAEAWSARELGDILRANLPAVVDRSLTDQDIGVLVGVEVVRRDGSGRSQVLRIRTDRATFDVWGDQIRWVLRPARGRFGILRSTMFELDPVVVDGRLVALRAFGGGFGHGVGLCQTGALAMARAGRTAGEILGHYYRDVRVFPRSRVTAIP